jgi:phosphate uptake regulator
MRRKIIKQGNNSFTLTLPIDWIRDSNLDGGSDIEINQEDNNLLISLPKDTRKFDSTITLDIKDYTERTIRNVLNQTYRKGYDKITLQIKNKEQQAYIRDITETTLLGFEVVEETPNKSVIQNIAEPSSEKFNVIFRKIFFSIQREAKEILEDFKQQKTKNTSQRKQTKDNVDKYTNLCRRLIIKDKIGGTKNSYLLLHIASRLSLIDHGYYYMYQFASEQKQLKISKEVIEVLERVNKLFELFSEAFYTKNIEKTHKIGVEKINLLDKTIKTLLQETKGTDNVLLYHLGEITRLIHMQSTNLFGLLDLDL